MVIRWSPGATAAYRAIRQRAAFFTDGFLPWPHFLSALMIDTDPNDSLLGSVLRDSGIWSAITQQVVPTPIVKGPGVPILSYVNLTRDVEGFAKADGAQVVGERHIAQLMARDKNNLAILSLRADLVYEKIRELELGPGLGDQTFRWHGIFDTNIVLQYEDFWTLDWRAIAKQPGHFYLTLWASSALLSEIDDQQYYGRNQRVSRKARTFARWLNSQIKTERDIDDGVSLNDRLLLRFLTLPLGSGSADTRHLEAAHALRDRGTKVTVISHDTLVRLRAIQAGFPVLDLPEDLLEEKDSLSKTPTR